jgi:hypothetical protein
VTHNGVTLRMTLSEWRAARPLADAWLAYTLPEEPVAHLPVAAVAAIEQAVLKLTVSPGWTHFGPGTIVRQVDAP